MGCRRAIPRWQLRTSSCFSPLVRCIYLVFVFRLVANPQIILGLSHTSTMTLKESDATGRSPLDSDRAQDTVFSPAIAGVPLGTVQTLLLSCDLVVDLRQHPKAPSDPLSTVAQFNEGSHHLTITSHAIPSSTDYPQNAIKYTAQEARLNMTQMPPFLEDGNAELSSVALLSEPSGPAQPRQLFPALGELLVNAAARGVHALVNSAQAPVIAGLRGTRHVLRTGARSARHIAAASGEALGGVAGATVDVMRPLLPQFLAARRPRLRIP